MRYLRIPTTPGKPIPQDLARWLCWAAFDAPDGDGGGQEASGG